ncbi:MAG: PorV/PorQ family protein [Bacteroidales bacterium]
MIKRSLIILAVLATSQFANAQMDMLGVSNDPRSLSLGNNTTTTGSSAYSIYSNAASVAFSEDRFGVGVSDILWMPSGVDVNIGALSGFYGVNNRLSLLVGARYSFWKDYLLMDEIGECGSGFRPYDYSIDLGAAYLLTDYLSGAVTLRYLNSRIFTEKASAFGMDVHLQMQLDRWTAGLSVTNIGSKFKYEYSSLVQPVQAKLGGAYDFFAMTSDHKLKAGAEVGYLFQPKEDRSFLAGAGVEYIYKSTLAFRGAYSYTDKDAFIPSFVSVGLGVKVAGIGLDAAYLIPTESNTSLKNTFSIGLSYCW